MPSDLKISRRVLVAGLLAAPIARPAQSAGAAPGLPKVVVAKDPTCGCCGAWVAHMRAAGFVVDVVETPELNRVKVRLGVPQDLASCHTAEVGGFVVEGHVPAAEVKRLLAEKPQAKGLAVPGMPLGSPGMETDGMAETYAVVLFGPSGRQSYARYAGARAL